MLASALGSVRYRTDRVARTRQHAPSACLSRLRERAGATVEVLPMTAYRSLQVFSHVVLGLMLAGIAYASAISIIYWTGISV